jgi:hypothetical protein
MEDLVNHIGTLISGRLSARTNLNALDRRSAERNRRPVGNCSGALMSATSKFWC